MKSRDEPVTLRSLDQHRVVVVLQIDQREVACCGKAFYEIAPSLGRVLRIELCDTPGQELLICEADWEGVIEPDDQHNCDYRLRLF